MVENLKKDTHDIKTTFMSLKDVMEATIRSSDTIIVDMENMDVKTASETDVSHGSPPTSFEQDFSIYVDNLEMTVEFINSFFEPAHKYNEDLESHIISKTFRTDEEAARDFNEVKQMWYQIIFYIDSLYEHIEMK